MTESSPPQPSEHSKPSSRDIWKDFQRHQTQQFKKGFHMIFGRLKKYLHEMGQPNSSKPTLSTTLYFQKFPSFWRFQRIEEKVKVFKRSYAVLLAEKNQEIYLTPTPIYPHLPALVKGLPCPDISNIPSW